MDVTKKLMQEHQLILKYIDLIKDYCQLIEKNPHDQELLEKLNSFIDFIRNYSDKYHHAKEEDILFKFMEKPGVLTHCNPIGQMLYEHDEGRKCIANIVEGLKEKDSEKVLENAQGWEMLLAEHIYKEDNILYPMAEQSLSASDKEEVNNLYQNAEKLMNGEKIEKRYQTLLNDLINFKNRY